MTRPKIEAWGRLTLRERWVESIRVLLERRIVISARRVPENAVLALETELRELDAEVSLNFDRMALAFNHRESFEVYLDALADSVEQHKQASDRLERLKRSIASDAEAFSALRKVIIETPRPARNIEPVLLEASSNTSEETPP